MGREMKTIERPAAGSKVRLSRVGWPERRGLVATVVDTSGAELVYPARFLQRSEILVRIENDPTDDTVRTLVNGNPWSCVVNLASIDLIEETADDGAAFEAELRANPELVRRFDEAGPADGWEDVDLDSLDVIKETDRGA